MVKAVIGVNRQPYCFSKYKPKMEVKYLTEWVEKHNKKNLLFKDIKKFRSHFVVSFFHVKFKLFVCFDTKTNFCFWSDKNCLQCSEKNSFSLFKEHLTKAVLSGIELLNNDRIILFHFKKVDIYNKENSYSLIFEFIPRYSNMILTRTDFNKPVIIDCLKKISFSENSVRQVLPGQSYSPPPVFDSNRKIDIPEYPLYLDLTNYKISGKPVNNHGFSDINSMFENLFFNGILINQFKSEAKQVLLLIKKNIAKKEKKLLKLQSELNAAEGESKWKKYAELLKFNLNSKNIENDCLEVTDYFAENCPVIKIPIQPDKNLLQNMQDYFKKFRKARKGKKKIKNQIELTLNEISELEKQLFELNEINDFQELSEFMSSADINQSIPSSSRKKKQTYKSIEVDEDWRIFIGRTSHENDVLTTRLAKPDDWWFHSRIFHGSHIILKNYKKKVPEPFLIESCSRLAAYYSKAKHSTNVPVDFTMIRYVTKPNGSPPGYVIYKNQKTLFVNPGDIKEISTLILQNVRSLNE